MKLIFFLALTVGILAGCSNQKATGENATSEPETTVVLTPTQVKNAGITLGKFQNREMASVLKLNGQIDVPPQNMVAVSAPLGGYLKTTKLLPGMFVRKGQVIAIMEDQQFIQLQQDYLTAKAKIDYLRHEYERQRELNQSKASSDKAFDQSEADYRTDIVLIKALSEKLKLAGIDAERLNEENISRSVPVYAPITGYVSKVNVNIGKYVAPTEVLFEIINPNDVHLALKVFEKDVSKLTAGQKLIAYTNDHPEKKYIGTVSLIGKDLTPERSTEVHCHFEQYDKSLVPGTYMNAEIQVKNKDASVLPEEAVVRSGDKEYVFIETGSNRFEMIATATGEKEDGYVEVILPENVTDKLFVTRGAYSLLMSLKNKTEE